MTEEAERIAGLYEKHAAAYDRLRGRSLFEQAWLDRFLGLVPDLRRVLDLGCGMGEPIAQYLIGQGCAVTGVDTSPHLIALCRARFPGAAFQVADMLTLQLGQSFDGILAWDSFFHLTADDQRAMFPVFRAHAGPDAVLMFTSGPEAGEAIGSFEGEPLYHASLDPVEYRELLGANGFEAIAFTPDDPGCGGHSVWLARRV